MADPMKRPHEELESQESEGSAKKKLSTDERLRDFLIWTEKNDFKMSTKVTVAREGSCAQYGMVAVADISEGDVLFQVPRCMLLSPETSGIASLVQSEAKRLAGGSSWVPLLLALMYEYHNPSSLWRPYQDLTPDFNELDLPMFWPRSKRESELGGTGVVEAIDRDLKSIENEFESLVLPFIKRHKETFSRECEDLEFYKKMVAFVMAYSFTEPVQEDDSDDEGPTTQPPMMVPLADILNHVAKNNAHLSFEQDCLKMVATTEIKQGEEVFNTYGELPNWQLLQMYGFAQAFPLNHYDTSSVEVFNQTLFDHANVLLVNTESLLARKRTFLKSLNFLGPGTSFVIGVNGILTGEELQPLLKVLCADKAGFAEIKASDGWSETEEGEDNSEDRFSFDHMKDLPKDWKLLLKMACKSQAEGYSKPEDDDTAALAGVDSLVDTRAIYSLHTRYGQRKLLHHLIDSVS